MFILRPMTMKVMQERKHQGTFMVAYILLCLIFKLTRIETRDGKKSYDSPPHSKEMAALNKRFGKVHGVSSLVNLVTLLATVYYGAVLGKKLS